MKLFTTLGSKLDSVFTRQKAFTAIADDNNQLYQMLYQMLGNGFSMPSHSIMNAIKDGYIVNPHLYSVINKKIKPAAKVPFYLYEEKADKKKEIGRYKAALEQGNFEAADFYQAKAYTLIEHNEISQILQSPNENESFSEWMEAMLGYYNLTGNGYVYGLTPDGFSPIKDAQYFSKLYTMPSQMTKIVTGSDWRSPITGYEVNWWGLGSKPIPKEQVCHIKMWNPEVDNLTKGLYGLSPMAPLCKVNQNSVDNFNAQMKLLQRGYPAGILTSETDKGATPEQAKQIQKSLDEKYGGDNYRRMLVTSASLKWQELGLNSVDLQLLESSTASLETIARAFNVPTILVNDDNTAYNNMTEASKSLWNNAIIPDISRIRDDVFNKFYLPYYRLKDRRKYFIDYDLASIEALRKDDKTLLETIAMEIENGLMTPNEGREMRGREIDNNNEFLNKYYLKQTLRPIDQPHTLPTETPKAPAK